MRSFQELTVESNSWIEESLTKVFDEELKEDITVKASYYSLLAGGKRIRPCLMYYSAKMLGVDTQNVLPFAVSLEMIHTYSLIHDDLPSMDNDDLRRGNPTCHKVYGEGIALLAGDNLLNRSFELIFQEVVKDNSLALAGSTMARLSGIHGMIGGQSIDLASEGTDIPVETLYELQRKKTGALLEAAITMPCYVGGKTGEELELLKKLSEHVGLAFQIMDDILDVESNSEELGKSTGKDERDNKSTFVSIFGLEGAHAKLNSEVEGCSKILGRLEELGYNTEELTTIVKFLSERTF